MGGDVRRRQAGRRLDLVARERPKGDYRRVSRRRRGRRLVMVGSQWQAGQTSGLARRPGRRRGITPGAAQACRRTRLAAAVAKVGQVFKLPKTKGKGVG